MDRRFGDRLSGLDMSSAKGEGREGREGREAEAALRSMCSVGENRRCFECGQRGPTYVDVTVGSFVCSRCSGLLRGLTPPHRVKSISMATFAKDEIDFVEARGNARCAAVWMALYEGAPPQLTDERAARDFLIRKYESKAYYSEAVASAPAPAPSPARRPPTVEAPPPRRPPQTMTTTATPPRRRPAPDPFESGFRANFAGADIFNSSRFQDAAPQPPPQPFFESDKINANIVSPDRYAALADLDLTLRQQNQIQNDERTIPTSNYNPFDSFVTSDNPKNPFRTNVPMVNGNAPSYQNPFAVGNNMSMGKSKNPFL